MDLISHYHNFFYVTQADTPELLEIAYKLRYEVYIKDCGYEFHNPYASDEIEKDNYDKCSLHCLLFHKPSNTAIGYVRLIPFQDNNTYHLPIEKFGIQFDNEFNKKIRSPEFGEISRMAIHPSFRRRLSDRLYLFEDKTDTQGCRFRVNYLPVCLVLACGVLMNDNQLEYSVALMERKLAVLIKKYGVMSKKIGESISLNGIRSPYMMKTREFNANLNTEFKKLYDIIHQELKPDTLTNDACH
ncbi:MAG: PEP-CTERM/exosortase system-associated acyltransferase [Gammaproteobacteria bacterium]|nr:PEP-CTERM/exosortase system-associated acyltransferase [Gammaproteobacteria bacterium]